MPTKPIPTGLIQALSFASLVVLDDTSPPLDITIEQRRPYKNPQDYERRTGTGFIAVHCADTPPDFKGDIADIRGWHIQERGWEDVGYHYVILRNGVIQTGRPLWAVGAGARGYNTRSVHICLMGGRFTKSEEKNLYDLGHDVNYSKTTATQLYTEDQLHALRFLLANLKAHKYPDADIRGHRDYAIVENGKTCPNFDVKSWLARQNLKPYEVNLDGSFWN